VTDEAEAQQLLTTLIPFAFFLRVERGGPSGPKSSSPKVLNIVPQQGAPVETAHYFVWFYEGSQVTTYLGGAALVAVMLAGVMFPLWPPIMRLGVWYLSIGVLGLVGLFFAIAIVRLIFYIITIIVASPGIWIFPQLFADVGFVRLFYWCIPARCILNISVCRLIRSFLCGNGIFRRRKRARGRLARRRERRRRHRPERRSRRS
jgi:translocation protein SEC62